MYIITKPEIVELLNKNQFENRVKKGFISYSNKQAVIPPVGELLFKEPPGEVHIKYGYIINEKYYVIKIASGFPRNGEIGLTNSQGIMLLFNQKSGEIESILLDDGYLTDIRTAIAGKICAKQFTNLSSSFLISSIGESDSSFTSSSVDRTSLTTFSLSPLSFCSSRVASPTFVSCVGTASFSLFLVCLLPLPCFCLVG